MRPDTPRGRLKHWMRQSGVADVRVYGFHSLRAGAATASAKAGVSERDIKQHGNWASDAVRAYIRPDEEERLRASNALGAR
jgi:integrase